MAQSNMAFLLKDPVIKLKKMTLGAFFDNFEHIFIDREQETFLYDKDLCITKSTSKTRVRETQK